MTPTETRQHVHELVDLLPPLQLSAIEGLLSVTVDPAANGLRNEPDKDEEINAEEEPAAAQAKEWFRQHEGTSMEEFVAELGLSMDQIRNYKE